jgi:hypothetical protein
LCNQCATPLNRRCPQCAHLNAPDAKFCAQCAAALGGQAAVGSDASASPVARGLVRVGPETQEASAALDGERKTVTALFADIKGSMELMEDLFFSPSCYPSTIRLACSEMLFPF